MNTSKLYTYNATRPYTRSYSSKLGVLTDVKSSLVSEPIDNVISFPGFYNTDVRLDEECIQEQFDNQRKKESEHKKETITKSSQPHGKLSKLEVQPITGDDIQRVKDYLLNKPERYKVRNIYNNTLTYNLRDYAMFFVNINIGLRISDFLSIKISDVMKNGKIVDSFIWEEGKTKKVREIPIVPDVQSCLLNYITALGDYKPDWYLFFNIHSFTPYEILKRETVWKQMKKIEKELEFSVPLGTHSMRKTFARAIYDKLIETNPMALVILQKILGHSSPDITLAYIGITRKDMTNLRLDVGTI